MCKPMAGGQIDPKEPASTRTGQSGSDKAVPEDGEKARAAAYFNVACSAS